MTFILQKTNKMEICKEFKFSAGDTVRTILMNKITVGIISSVEYTVKEVYCLNGSLSEIYRIFRIILVKEVYCLNGSSTVEELSIIVWIESENKSIEYNDLTKFEKEFCLSYDNLLDKIH